MNSYTEISVIIPYCCIYKLKSKHAFSLHSSKFFSLICSMEQIDVTLKWYKDLIPSVRGFITCFLSL